MATITKINNPPKVESNLFCFHWVGGGVNSCRALAKVLAVHNIQVFAVTLPGRYTKQIDAIIRDIGEVVESIQKQFVKCVNDFGLHNCPLFFFGHSYGGIVAYELAKRLQIISINKLIVSAIKSPVELTKFNKSTTTVFHHKQNDKELFDYIKDIGGLPEGLDPMFVINMLPTIRGDYEAFEKYDEVIFGRNKLTCPIIAFNAIGDVAVDKDSMLDWKDCTTGSFEIVDFPGSHFYLIEPKSVTLFEQEIIKNIKN